MKDTVKDKTREMEEIKTELNKKEKEHQLLLRRAPSDEWKSKIETAESDLKKERDLRLEKEKEITRVNNEKDLLQKDNVRLQSEEKKLSQEVQDLHTKVSQLEKLSPQTAAHVLDNNPNVRDPNRPQKLGEKLAQVYDDQWVDATDALEKIHKNEEEILKILSDLLTVKGEKLPEIPTEVRKGIKEYRKKIAKQVWPVIEKEILTKLKKDHAFEDSVTGACMSYVKKCVELCWLMRVKDPPVCLKWDVPSDDTFDSDVYRAYTKSGSHVANVVWPAMYLYEGGPILMKGVAQGCKK